MARISGASWAPTSAVVSRSRVVAPIRGDATSGALGAAIVVSTTRTRPATSGACLRSRSRP